MKKQNRQAANGAAMELRAVLISGFLNGWVHLTILWCFSVIPQGTRALL